MSSLKSEIRSSFKLNGFQLKLDASRHLESLLTPLEARGEAGTWVQKIIDALTKKNLTSGVITADLIDWAVEVRQI